MNEKLCDLLAKFERESETRHEQRIKQAKDLRSKADRMRQKWLAQQEIDAIELEEYEHKRNLVRGLMMKFVEPAQCENVPLEEILWFTILFCAGALACYDLADPVDLKLRRLGRQMQTTQVEF